MLQRKNKFIGHIVDIEHREIYPGEILIDNGKITAINKLDHVEEDSLYYLPGLTDSHIHIESSMLTPQEFSRFAVAHGAVNAICDPHEIANVLGVEGVDFMIHNAQNSRFNFFFGLPSCVPSSQFETAGATFDTQLTRELIKRDDLYFLAEMANFPGVVNGDPATLGKIKATQQVHKVVDGHAPGLSGSDLKKYISAGVSTDHECIRIEEAREKLKAGMKIIIREGSAACNFEALYPLIDEVPDSVMLCSDDRHPDDLQKRHIDELIHRGLAKGLCIWNLLQAACINPIHHYHVPTGIMHVGDPATFITVNNLKDFQIEDTYIDGYRVYNRITGTDNEALITQINKITTPNKFNAVPISLNDLKVNFTSDKVKVIKVFDGQLYTKCHIVPVKDLHAPQYNKIVVYNRYGNGHPQVAYIEGFGLKAGAIGSTVAHDSHNIVVIGSSDKDIEIMTNALIKSRGGMGVVNGSEIHLLPLPIAGLMSDKSAEEVANGYRNVRHEANKLGTPLKSPFITMSFMALPVIPEIKLTDKGLVYVDKTSINFTNLMAD